MDDSRAALIKAYNAVRERYNKLRLQYRQLLKDKTCLQCREKLNASVDLENCPDSRKNMSVRSQRLSNDANEIDEICDQLKQLDDAGLVSDGIHSVIAHLQNVAGRMTANAAFDEQQDSLLNASASEVLSSLASLSHSQLEASEIDLLHSQQVRSVTNVTENSEDLVASKTCEMSGDGDQENNSVIGKLNRYLLLLKQFCTELCQITLHYITLHFLTWPK